MAERTQRSNILLAFISLTAVIAVVSLIGFFTLGKGPEIIQGQAEADEYRVSGKVPARILELRVKEGDKVKAGDTLVILDLLGAGLGRGAVYGVYRGIYNKCH